MASPTFQIPADVIEPIIQAQITASILTALGDNKTRVMEKAIASILVTSVDENGKPTTYNGRPWIDWAVSDSVRKAAKAAIESHLANNTVEIEKQLLAELQKKNSPLAKQLCANMVGAISAPETLKWRLTIACDTGR